MNGDELVPTNRIIHCTEAKRGNFDIGNVFVDGAFFVIVLDTFVAEHLDVDVLVNVVQSCLIRINSVA